MCEERLSFVLERVLLSFFAERERAGYEGLLEWERNFLIGQVLLGLRNKEKSRGM
jgi:hypothetical protein